MQIIPDPDEEEPRLLTPATFAGVYASVVVLANLFIAITIATEHGWGAMGVALYRGPLINLLVAVSGSIALLLLHLLHKPGFPIDGLMALAWSLPVGGILLDFMVFFLMPRTGGC